MQDFKWPFRLSFFPPLHDHDVVTIHLYALDTSPVGLSCLLIWPCFFGPFLDLSPVRRDALVPFPRLHGETGPASHRLALLLCTVRRDASVPGFHGTLFQSKCSLPCHRVFVNFDLRAAVGLGVILHTRPVPEPRNLGNSLCRFVGRSPHGPKPFAEL